MNILILPHLGSMENGLQFSKNLCAKPPPLLEKEYVKKVSELQETLKNSTNRWMSFIFAIGLWTLLLFQRYVSVPRRMVKFAHQYFLTFPKHAQILH